MFVIARFPLARNDYNYNEKDTERNRNKEYFNRIKENLSVYKKLGSCTKCFEDYLITFLNRIPEVKDRSSIGSA